LVLQLNLKHNNEYYMYIYSSFKEKGIAIMDKKIEKKEI
jgi:hypothetical protein